MSRTYMMPSEVIKNHRERVKIVDKADPVDTMWGIEAYSVTRDQVEQLLNGKCIYFEDGEYANIIFVEEKEA